MFNVPKCKSQKHIILQIKILIFKVMFILIDI